MANTIVGVYDDIQTAQAVLNELTKSGFAIEKIRLSPEDESFAARGAALRHDQETEERHRGVFGVFRNLFGTPGQDRHADMYSEAVRRGSFLLTVHTENDAQNNLASDIMHRHNPVDIDERVALWKAAGWSAYDQSAAPYSETEIQQERGRYGSTYLGTQPATSQPPARQPAGKVAGEQHSIPVIQEELQVGKREVQRGGVRVFQHVTETPVSETVHLREEHVSVERHPVDQPATADDLAQLKEGSFEMRERAEEAVVAKSARVVEEVIVGKDVAERDQVISDSVRRSDVEIEQLTGAEPDDSLFRSHWATAYGQSGMPYEEYAPAYQYGKRLAAEERYRNFRFSDMEPDIERDWSAHYAGRPWAKFKDAVRYGWEKVTK